MWYFAWLLGLPLAALFAVVNAMWLEMQEDRKLMQTVPVPTKKA
ncbi:cytochrome bd-I oxidase subunit CydX [Rhizobium alvei]|uniref:Cytochrome bd-I oxidase subunit CydX n=1 Tax=Rhizobium alvei TaxID=1132659 RepID=A0ABT8YI15_9HYPH|nr:cytochrome bd-I oxidase subunit CydX [Rhizobium alvei]MDO6962905.1 cytochrome bd-I oxidase subunit CydX [Rhizobium alvei]